MAERVTIRPTRSQHVRWSVLALVVALLLLMTVHMLTADPTRLHCTETRCWETLDGPLGEFTEEHVVSGFARGDEQIDFGRGNTALERRFDAFLAAPAGQVFDATYDNSEKAVVGLAIISLLVLWALIGAVRGSSADIVVDRAASQLIVRSWPLMFGRRERRGKLEGARADIEVRKAYLVLPRRYLVVRSDYETLLDMRVLGKRDDLAAVRALLQQPA